MDIYKFSKRYVKSSFGNGERNLGLLNSLRSSIDDAKNSKTIPRDGNAAFICLCLYVVDCAHCTFCINKF